MISTFHLQEVARKQPEPEVKAQESVKAKKSFVAANPNTDSPHHSTNHTMTSTADDDVTQAPRASPAVGIPPIAGQGHTNPNLSNTTHLMASTRYVYGRYTLGLRDG